MSAAAKAELRMSSKQGSHAPFAITYSSVPGYLVAETKKDRTVYRSTLCEKGYCAKVSVKSRGYVNKQNDGKSMNDLKVPELQRIAHGCEGGIYLCHCCALDVMTQGATKVAARRNLTEAVALFFESCSEMGMRDEIFQELGFRDTPTGVFPPARCYSRCCPCQPEED